MAKIFRDVIEDKVKEKLKVDAAVMTQAQKTYVRTKTTEFEYKGLRHCFRSRKKKEQLTDRCNEFARDAEADWTVFKIVFFNL